MREIYAQIKRIKKKGKWEMIIKIELPDKLDEAIDLFCKVCNKLLDDANPMSSKPVVKKSKKTEASMKDLPPGKMSTEEQESVKPAELPDDEKFARLGLPEMQLIMADPNNLTAFRFRAFARAARHVFGKKVELLATSINKGGINAILTEKRKDQAAQFIQSVNDNDFPRAEDDIEF